MGCGAEAVYNYSLEKEINPDGSGDDDDDNNDDDDDIDYQWPVTTVGTTVIPTRASLSTSSRQTTKAVRVDAISITLNRSVTRLPPRFTPIPENRLSSLQHLLRLHLNTFNQRLSMLESNTLDMKESILNMEKQQSQLGSQLKQLITIHSVGEKNQKVGELEQIYTDMEVRLTRLEGRLEILIDGFTALAQEMNKMKRTSHTLRSPHKRRVLPSLATVVAVPPHSTPQPSVKPTEKSLTRRATVPKSIPTPSIITIKPTSALYRGKLKTAVTTKPANRTTKLQSVTGSSRSQVSPRSPIRLKTTLSKPGTVSKSTVMPVTKRPGGRRSAVTAKHLPQPRQTKTKEVKNERTITKFQLEPPSHKPKPALTPQLHKQSRQAGKEDSAQPGKHNKSFRADAPVQKNVQEGVKSPGGHSKKPSRPHKGSSEQIEKTTELLSQKKKTFAKDTLTTTKPAIAKKPKTTAAKIKAATLKKKSNTTVKRTATTTKPKTTAVKTSKKTQHKKKTKSQSGVLDLLKLLKGDRKNHDGSLHVVLGKLAIPIKIIPDN